MAKKVRSKKTTRFLCFSRGKCKQRFFSQEIYARQKTVLSGALRFHFTICNTFHFQSKAQDWGDRGNVSFQFQSLHFSGGIGL